MIHIQKDGTGTTQKDRAASTDDITGTYLCGNGSCQCLEGRKSSLLLATLQRHIAEHQLHALSKATNLHKARADRVEQTDAYEQEEKNVIGEIVVDRRHDLV